MRGRVMAGRAATRRSVQIVVGVTVVFVLGLVLFNPTYVQPYRSPLGQLVLAVVVLFFGAGFFWLRRLATYDVPERFLHAGRPVPDPVVDRSELVADRVIDRLPEPARDSGGPR
jgi:hypothetical protein